ncbi:MAG: DUF192 domain-containing protein [Hydrogenovibrio sp.]|uniref:DUF192 domain-containing protein n=1 Tax=Hydrogenovibrio sp. TaxID=2065821 RepID=UPI00286FCAD3|nr:DUF192 domain-containing protein [Hydrogenovibrio sp.]MDR9499879.1 DUF192 domain-containing protein [Hydrogenovibrio sp.]
MMCLFQSLRVFALCFGWALYTGLGSGCSSLPEERLQTVDFTSSSTGSNVVTLRLKALITESEKAKGLMFEPSVPQNGGVLLVYDQEAERSIWMKNMKTPIDVIFLDAKGQITRLISRLEPCRKMPCRNFNAKKTKYIVETVPGFIKKHNLTQNKTKAKIK